MTTMVKNVVLNPPPTTLDATCIECGESLAQKKERKKKPKPMEMIGPVFITFIEPTRKQYWVAIMESAITTLAFFFLGMGVAMILQYTLAFKFHWTMALHVLFNTLGCQFLITSAYLLDNDMFIPSLSQDKAEREKECLYLTIFAHLMFISSNTVVIYFYHPYLVRPKAHALIGLINYAMTILYTPVLIMSIFKDTFDDYMYIFTSMGVLSYMCCMLSYVSGLFTPSMNAFFPHPHIPVFVSIISVFYTIVALKKPVLDVYQSLNII